MNESMYRLVGQQYRDLIEGHIAYPQFELISIDRFDSNADNSSPDVRWAGHIRLASVLWISFIYNFAIFLPPTTYRIQNGSIPAGGNL